VKLAEKGLIVVLLPVVFELAFVLRVNDLLQQTDGQIAKEVHAVQFLLANQNLNADIVHANTAALSYQCYKLQKFKDEHEQSSTAIATDLITLRKLASSPDELGMVKGFYHRQRAALNFRRMMMSSAGAARMSSLFGGEAYSRMLSRGFFNGDLNDDPIEAENRRQEAEATAQSAVIHRTLHGLLQIGVLVSLMLSTITAVLFHRQIYSRLHRIVANIDRMIRRVTLIPPAKASDEIGELDLAIYQTANSIRTLEQFRAKGAKLMAVELEQPLGTVAQALDDLRDKGFAESTVAGSESLDSARSLASRLQNLLGDLMSIDQISEARLRLQMESGNVGPIVRQAIDATATLASTAGIAVKSEIDDFELECDRDRLTQVLINLLSNAIKFSPANSEITVECFKEAEYAGITVLDHGKGIDPAFQSKIFHRFEQASETDQDMGSGLGLSICRELIEAHGGIMDFESEPGRTKFKVKIPLAKVDAGVPAISQSPYAVPQRQRSLWQKGMALVVAPAIVQLGVVAVLFFLVDRAEQQMTTFRHARQIAFACSDTTDDLLRMIFASMLYNTSREPSLAKQLNERAIRMKADVQNLQQISAANPHDKRRAAGISTWTLGTLDSMQQLANSAHQDILLDEWVKNDPKFKPLAEQAADIGRSLEAWTKEGESQLQQQAAMSAEARRTIMSVLMGGLVCSILATLGVALAFARGVCARIAKIISNSRRLVSQEPLLPPDGRSRDEIDTIDEEFYAAAQHLRELDRFKEELLSVTSHELRTPLTGLLGTFELLATGMYGKLTTHGERTVALATNAASDLVSLITNFLDLEKMRAGKVLVGPVPMTVSSLMEFFEDRIENIQTTTQVPEALTLKADADRLVQAISSIIKTSTAAESVNITLQETGLQLSLPNAPQAQGHDSTFSQRQLTLQLCEMIAQQHGGKFSEEEERLVFTLPT
jgi:signal transduction histidine kinase